MLLALDVIDELRSKDWEEIDLNSRWYVRSGQMISRLTSNRAFEQTNFAALLARTLLLRFSSSGSGITRTIDWLCFWLDHVIL